MQRKRLKGYIAVGVLVCSLVFGTKCEASSTNSRLQDAKNKKAQTEENINKTQNNLNDLNSERAGLQEYVDNLNEKLQSASIELSELQELIAQKETDIAESEEALKEAKQAQIEQYEAMKTRIKFMYENGNTVYMELFLSAGSFSEFLNKNDYFTKLTEYDREKLDEYVHLQEKIERNEQDLKDARTALESLQDEADEKAESVAEVVKEASENLNECLEQISEEE